MFPEDVPKKNPPVCGDPIQPPINQRNCFRNSTGLVQNRESAALPGKSRSKFRRQVLSGGLEILPPPASLRRQPAAAPAPGNPGQSLVSQSGQDGTDFLLGGRQVAGSGPGKKGLPSQGDAFFRGSVKLPDRKSVV